jgi:hypothetical protein
MWCCAAAFFLASGAALSQEVANSKINVQSACTLNTEYYTYKYASEVKLMALVTALKIEVNQTCIRHGIGSVEW